MKQRNVLWAMVLVMVVVFAVGTLDFTSERAGALWTAVVERAQAALIDHGFGA